MGFKLITMSKVTELKTEAGGNPQGSRRTRLEGGEQLESRASYPLMGANGSTVIR
jgi:hypothetical protein